MEIIIANPAGFCFGVRRAVKTAEKMASVRPEVNTLGPLIHNRPELERLAEMGVSQVESVEEARAGTLIIRTHGIGPRELGRAREKGLEVADATCPYVLRLQRKAKEWSEAGWQVVLIGEKNHPEIRGVMAWCEGKAEVIASAEEARMMPFLPRRAVLAQTTQTTEGYAEVIDVLREHTGEIRFEDTICLATRKRQEATRQLAGEADVVLVVGGKNSANTGHLADIGRDAGCSVHLIERGREIEIAWFSGKDKVGITAGASTPAWIIKEVCMKMDEIKEQLEKNGEGAGVVVEPPSGEDSHLLAEDSRSGEVGEGPVGELMPQAGDETAVPKAVVDNGDEAEMMEESVNYIDTFISFRPGQVVAGKVIEVGPEGVLVDVGYKSEGIIPLRELSHRFVENPGDVVRVGDEINVRILSINPEEGTLRLSRRQVLEGEAWDRLQKSRAAGEILEVNILEAVKGGLVADVGLRAFIPASHVDVGFANNLEQYVGKPLRVKVLELERNKRRAILSSKVVLEEERNTIRERIMGTVEEGAVFHGRVKSLTSFGAFIDLGGLDGLLHISEMSWGRVMHPSEVMQPGQEVDVIVLRLDREKDKISLGMKQLLPNPWEKISAKYPEGAIILGRVARLVSFGAFVELEPGVDGLVHISHLSRHRVQKPEEVVQPGSSVYVQVIKVDSEGRRINLSMRGIEQPAREKGAATHKTETENEAIPKVLGDDVVDMPSEIGGKNEAGDVPSAAAYFSNDEEGAAEAE